MSWLDLVILAIIISSMLFGFSQGFVMQAINLAALYFGISLAAAYTGQVNRFLRQYLGASQTLTRDTIVFLAIALSVWSAILIGVRYSFSGFRIRTGRSIDHLGGMVIGLTLGFVWALLLVMVLAFISSVPWPQYDEIRFFIFKGLQRSFLRPVIVRLMPLLIEAVRPWIPGGIPPIFTTILNVID